MKKVVKWVLIICAVLFVLLFAIIACSDPATDETTSSSDATAGMTPQEIDLEMYRPVRSARASYDKLTDMINGLGTGESSTLDVYDYCKQVSDWAVDWSDTAEAMTNDQTSEYGEAARYYIGNVALIARDTMDYIDEQDMEKLSTIKDGIQLMPTYEADLLTARKAYLSAAGLSDDEIQKQIDLG